MEPRVFYPGGPRDVIAGFLSIVVAIGLVVLLIGSIWELHVYSAFYWGFKFFGFKLGALLVVGMTSMLYREQIFVNPWEQTVQLRRSWFLVPVGSTSFPYSQVKKLDWERDGERYKLVLSVGDENLTLLRRGSPDPLELQEVATLLNLPGGSE